MAEFIEVDLKDHVQTIKLNRPQQRNALSRAMLEELSSVLATLRKSDDTRVVIFCGEGEQVFCAGADLKERRGMNEEETLSFVSLIQKTFHDIANLPMPTIAAVGGHAFGGGLELALACDMRVVSEKASLGLTECALGIIPGAGGTQRLPQIVGMAKALAMICSAEKIDGREAFRIGLCQQLACDYHHTLELANKTATAIKKCAPLAVRAAKKAVLSPMQQLISEGLKAEMTAYQSILHTKDRQEGILAFKEKRPPLFQGR